MSRQYIAVHLYKDIQGTVTRLLGTRGVVGPRSHHTLHDDIDQATSEPTSFTSEQHSTAMAQWIWWLQGSLQMHAQRRRLGLTIQLTGHQTLAQLWHCVSEIDGQQAVTLLSAKSM